MSQRSHDAVAFIFARGGSKGVPRKNIRLLHGKPLIAHSILLAQRCPSIRRIIVSTEDAEIAAVARQFGAEVPFMRPAELASDTADEHLAWQHATRQIFGEVPSADAPCFVSLPATCPFRAVEDVEACLARLQEGFDAVATVTPADSNPYFTMVTLNPDGSLAPLMPGARYARRQDAPAVYDLTAVAFVTRPSYILKTANFYAGKVGVVVVPPERALDIDTPHDFAMAEALMTLANH
jgi:N-acylneuraminate cytidylyltransferase